MEPSSGNFVCFINHLLFDQISSMEKQSLTEKSRYYEEMTQL